MKKKYYTVAVASLAATAVAVAPAAAAEAFSDVTKNNAHYEGITALHTAGVISGYPDGTFKPANDVTRGQAAKMIAGALGLDTKNVENPKLADLPTTHQYYGAIAALAELGAIEFYVDDNTVAPNEVLTRGEFVFMLVQGLGIEEEVEVEDADNTITRGEVATLLYEALSDEVVEEEQTTTEDAATVEQTTTDTALLETVFTKAIEKQSTVESMKATMTMTQSMTFQEGTEQTTVNASGNMKMSIVNKPMQFFIEGTMSVLEPTSGEAIDMPLKMYMTEKDGMYMYEGFTSTWIKYPSAMFDEVLAQAGAQVNAAEQLAMLQKFASDFKLEEAGNYYVLKLTGDGEGFTALVQEQLNAMNLGLGEEELAEMQNMKFDQFTYEIKVHKETFVIEEMVIDLGIGIASEGVKIKVTNKSTIKYSDFNAVTTITIPQEVLDNAEELDLSAIEEVEATNEEAK
ncbi:S-layer homology domain-containing protein [Metasolibacillus meyeri]|uniref:S-layer homology domain-containing protein n=1 Tax=Metasolibacillus meyeri TaxID=1071052 RepID=A0AAW9NR10_9BACL|nr:S-layer homology domain-containing protein [Metasolibacillus meyeri]MEC1177221.1 S-layer homology domain-containing protein [Metasolibacillus meyeri]